MRKCFVGVVVLTVVFLLAVAGPARAICLDEMKAYWGLDESEGAVYKDLFGNNAGCTNCPASSGGVISGAQAFNKNDLSANAAEAFNWGVADSFSVEFWVKTDPASICTGNQVMIGRDDPASSLHWWVGCFQGGKPFFELMDKSGAEEGVIGTTTLTDGAWHHVVAVRDAALNEIRLYVDGELESSAGIAYTGGFDSTAQLNIGWLNLGTGFHFIGSLDEVALYKKAFSGQEVNQNYLDSVAGVGYCDGATANRPPGTPGLLYPAEGQKDLPATVTLKWLKCTDPEGDNIQYEVYCCENADFSGCEPVRMAAVSGFRYAGAGMLFFGLTLAGIATRRRKLWYLLAATMMAGFLLLASCGGGGGGSSTGSNNPGPSNPAVDPNELTHTATLKPATTYSWKVVATDGRGGKAESQTRTFTTK